MEESGLSSYEEDVQEYIGEKLNAPTIDEYEAFNDGYLSANTELNHRMKRAEREKLLRRLAREERKRTREAYLANFFACSSLKSSS